MTEEEGVWQPRILDHVICERSQDFNAVYSQTPNIIVRIQFNCKNLYYKKRVECPDEDPCLKPLGYLDNR